MNLEPYVKKARESKFGMRKLNFGLSRIIPFNRPHRIKLIEISDDYVKSMIPYRRKNLNHIKSIHACGLATAAEFASGFLLLLKLGTKEYRLIMESIEAKYLYQAKEDVTATFKANDQWFADQIRNPLQNEDKVYVKCEINLHDALGNHVAIVQTNWQIKKWSRVKTSL